MKCSPFWRLFRTDFQEVLSLGTPSIGDWNFITLMVPSKFVILRIQEPQKPTLVANGTVTLMGVTEVRI